MSVDKIIHGVAGAIVALQALAVILGMDPALAAAIVAVVVAFMGGYRTDRSSIVASEVKA